MQTPARAPDVDAEAAERRWVAIRYWIGAALDRDRENRALEARHGIQFAQQSVHDLTAREIEAVAEQWGGEVRRFDAGYGPRLTVSISDATGARCVLFAIPD